ncbi:MAG: isochorismatase family protein [Desulfobacterales bacterium]|nr:isochorismatase family protein [Desulfobacterales bacterium]
MKKNDLVIIDPQNDFCLSDGALSVPGAERDMKRLSTFIERSGSKINNIHCSIDHHHYFDISHPAFWIDKDGKNPSPFTIITGFDLKNGFYKTDDPIHSDYAFEYVKKLEINNRYPLCIWPEHCLIGSPGSNIVDVVNNAFVKWEKINKKTINYIFKGLNNMTEHYSAVKADVEDPLDSTTKLNNDLILKLKGADQILFAGEASSHCLKFTVEDIADALGEDYVKKMVLLSDCTSPVGGFKDESDKFIKAMQTRGMQITDSIYYS